MRRRFSILRRLLAALSLLAMTTVFFIPAAARWLGWLPRLQLVPALCAGAVLELAVLILMIVFFGRLYCSILCPLGILQDFTGLKALRPKAAGMRQSRPRPIAKWIRRAILIGFVSAIPFGFAGFIEPYGIFGRFLSIGICRAGEPTVAVTVWALGLMIMILLANWASPRWWCNHLCPVGTFLGLFSRLALFRLRINPATCVKCGACARGCEQHALAVREDKSIAIDPSACIVCGHCLSVCPKGANTLIPLS